MTRVWGAPVINGTSVALTVSVVLIMALAPVMEVGVGSGHGAVVTAGAGRSLAIPRGVPKPGVTDVRPTSRSMSNPTPTTYGNATFVLPGYVSLNSFVNVTGASSVETNGAQVPILSWTADGVFYVNASDDLVFYNFATTTVTKISSWTPLYEDLMDYNGVANTEYITQDGTEIYTIGCPTSCQGTPQPNVEIEVANVSTGVVWTYAFVGLTYSSPGGLGETGTNVQALLIGLNGNDNEAVVVDYAGEVYGILVGSPAATTPTRLTVLSYFEANNLDWAPSLNSFINEQAGGSTADGWQQLRWNGVSLSEVGSGAWGSEVKATFADAGGYNITAGQWSLTAGICSTRQVVDGDLPISAGTAGSFQPVLANNNVDSCPYAPPHPPLNAGGNLGVEGGGSDRVPITAAGPFVAEGWNNTSAVLNPVTGEWYTLGSGADPGIYGPSATFSTANLFHNGSYLVSPRSGACEITCTLLGAAGATSAGTEWWLWNRALSEFPYGPTSPLQETSVPPPPILTASSIDPTSATASWTESTTEGPLLNFTLCWSATSSACTHWVPLMPWTTSYTVGGLTSGMEVHFSVFALNYHYFGPSASRWVTVAPPPPYAARFEESGLPSGTVWYVNVSGESPITSEGTTAVLDLGNGVYAIRFSSSNTTYRPVLGLTSLTVAGAPVHVNVSFAEVTYGVRFSQSGLPPGTTWTVLLSGVEHNSTASNFTSPEPNGTYPFTVQPVAGTTITPGGGTVTVDGVSVDVEISFTLGTKNSSPNGGSSGPVLGLPRVEGYALVAAVALTALVVGVLVSIGRGRRGNRTPPGGGA